MRGEALVPPARLTDPGVAGTGPGLGAKRGPVERRGPLRKMVRLLRLIWRNGCAVFDAACKLGA